jgi:hypothetical protein
MASRRQRPTCLIVTFSAMKNRLMFASCLGMMAALPLANLKADDRETLNTRYGLFDLLDHRSSYGQGAFPEPFLIDDSDLETREFRLDWRHTAAGSDHSDVAKAELEYGVGPATLELEIPYERDVAGGEMTEGMANVSLAARCPVFQFVSPNGLVDSTFGIGAELGIPTTSDVSHNTELVPKVFEDVQIGNFTIQSVFGDSMLFGPGADGGLNTFEYGFVFGYTVPRKLLPLPGIQKLIPVAELSGETALNHGAAGQNRLTADAGLRVNLKAIGRIQPRPGVVFVFPVDNGSRQEQHWGTMTSLVFEF